MTLILLDPAVIFKKERMEESFLQQLPEKRYCDDDADTGHSRTWKYSSNVAQHLCAESEVCSTRATRKRIRSAEQNSQNSFYYRHYSVKDQKPFKRWCVSTAVDVYSSSSNLRAIRQSMSLSMAQTNSNGRTTQTAKTKQIQQYPVVIVLVKPYVTGKLCLKL